MKRAVLYLAVIVGLVYFSCNPKSEVLSPVAEKIPEELTMHGHTRIDNYYWMRLSDEQKNSEVPDEQTKRVLDYLNAENEYLDKMLGHTETLQEKLFNEMKGRIKQDDESVPYLENGYYYYTRYEEGKEYPLYYRKKGSLEAEEELLLDVNKLAEGKKYCSVSRLSISPDNDIMAYGVDYVSRRRYDIHFIDLATGDPMEDVITNTTGSATWANDNKTLFYVGKNTETLRSERIVRHKLGRPVGEDVVVYFEEDEEFTTRVGKTKSRKFLVINNDQTLSTETMILEADNPDGSFRMFEPRQVNHEYSIDHIGNSFYIRTNVGGASNFKLMKTGERNTGKDSWTDVIPHRDDVLLQGFELFDEYMTVSERINGLNNLRVFNMADGTDYYLEFDEEVYSARLRSGTEAGTENMRYSYTSLTTPSSVFEFNMRTKEKILLKEDEVLGGFDKENYESKRLWATADDSTQVPISLVYRKGFIQDGKSPLLLYAYGSYGASRDPSFNSNILSLLDRGFAYAIAHIRGGSEMGRYWYEDGKLLKKINTFTDYNDCAEFLINEKYSSPERLFAQGGSAGGLLMGAILNLQPELFKGVIAGVPFVDVVTTMLDPTIPLTTFEWDEWGDPREKEYYDYMLSYSPYDQVQTIDYPNILITTGFWDSQVQYWEPAKWIAKLRDMKTDDNLLVMKCNMVAGHGGASGRFERLKTTALEYAFMLDLVGTKD
ncbi:MAG TPA: S9 family peptidase [Bacteroidales bacterium]|nr:S9 family peptidase [Bacteroidales bacterium]